MNPQELKGAIEAIIYAADEPATLDQLVNATGAQKEEVRQALDEMIAACAADERGIEIRRVARGYKYSTKPQHHELVRKFLKSLRPPVRLSMPALETLAVISYKQPITLPEIQDIRGVNCSGVIQTLLDKHLVTTAGRKPVIGRPILYRTTKEFLVRFGLNDVDELPSLKEFEQMAREALGPEEGIEIVAEEGAGEAGVEERAAEPQAAEAGAESHEAADATADEIAEETAGTELAAAGPAIPAEEETAEIEIAVTESAGTEAEVEQTAEEAESVEQEQSEGFERPPAEEEGRS
ncbi:MAG: SMC-Scp complex subunit ScpB [Acidobacteriota bacterium]|nr:SMC-Scp complex subunit ScpB [Acidobacteriota bacterium]